MNKEDIWVSSIPVPVKEKTDQHANDNFDKLPVGKELESWNIYSPAWAPVKIGKTDKGERILSLKDSDLFDYAKAERVIPATKKLFAEISVTPLQMDNGLLDIEFQDAKGTPGIRLSFDSPGVLRTKAGYRNKTLLKYTAGTEYKISVNLNTETRLYSVTVNGKNTGNNILFAPLESVERLVFRTGDVRRFPDADTPTDQMYDLKNTEKQDKPAEYHIRLLKTGSF